MSVVVFAKGGSMRSCCNILIVEDDLDDVFWLLRALRTAGDAAGRSPRIETVWNGQEAVDLLGELGARGELPQVVTLDLNMPILDGIGVLKIVRSTPLLAKLKTIVVTTSIETRLHKDAIDAGADDVFVKPQNHMDILGLAEQVIRYC
jgi:CheY-like chemotaxis protein